MQIVYQVGMLRQILRNGESFAAIRFIARIYLGQLRMFFHVKVHATDSFITLVADGALEFRLAMIKFDVLVHGTFRIQFATFRTRRFKSVPMFIVISLSLVI